MTDSDAVRRLESVKPVAQLGMDETVIDDRPLEKSLEERERLRARLGIVRAEYREAHAAAKVLIDQRELPDGMTIRVGAFRVSRQTVPGRSVSFETGPTSRITITAVES